MIEEWNLAKTNMQRLKKIKPEVAVLGTAAIEPHNLHLPEGQDMLHTNYIVEQCSRRAWEKTKKVICLPTIPFGVDCNLLDFPLAIHISQQSLDSVIRDIITSLFKQGIGKIVIINGHGGNDFTPLIRQIQCEMEVHVFQSDWWKSGLDHYDSIFEHQEDHAGEMETSVALALYPDLVEMAQAGAISVPPYRFEALRQGWVKTSRNFKRLNSYCATADPAKATAEKGQKYLDLVIDRLSRFLIELAESPVDDLFPHQADPEMKTRS
jgi:creatinine amidohydrolase